MLSLRSHHVLRRVLPSRTLSIQAKWLVRRMHNNNHNSSLLQDIPPAVKIVEVGPRDGLQNESVVVSTEDKIELIIKLAESGCRFIEAGSFVSPKWVPAMADSADVLQGVNEWRTEHNKEFHNVVFSCLVPNVQGLERATNVGVDEIAIFASASEAFSQHNLNCSIQESMQRFAQVTTLATENNIPIRGYLSCVLGCPYQGRVAPSVVARVAEKLIALGCHEVSLGDTIGVGTPASTIAMLDAVQDVVVPTEQLAVHFHDTYGQALANILVSLDRGIATVDSSVAGLGGCPYAKGASGNVATEDVVYMLHGLGVETGVNLDQLVDAGEFICNVLGRDNRSKVAAAMIAKRQDGSTSN